MEETGGDPITAALAALQSLSGEKYDPRGQRAQGGRAPTGWGHGESPFLINGTLGGGPSASSEGNGPQTSVSAPGSSWGYTATGCSFSSY